MELSPWTFFVDLSIMGALLIFGQFLRAKVKIFQKVLIPASLSAGFIGLVLGPNGFRILPLSDQIGTYASILIVIVFACMPIGDKINKEKLSAVGGMFTNVTGIAVAQYAIGLIIVVYILSPIFEGLNPGIGLMMATGFYGGHGTAAAVGSAYADLGWPEATDLGMFAATVGIVGGIVIGMVIINWGTRKDYTNYVKSPKDLPIELRTGFIPKERQKAGGKITVANISIDPITFHFSLVLIPSILGYFTSKFINSQISWLSIPAFCLSLAWAFIVQFVLNKSSSDQYVDRFTISRISGTCTDFLVVAGIASVKISVVLDYIVPLFITFVAGFILNWIWFIAVGKYSAKKDWFERNMMVWGHASGVVATGILLLRVVDPDMKSRGLEDSGISDIINRPIIIGLQVLPPILLTMGGLWTHITTWGIVAITIFILLLARIRGWWTPGKMQFQETQEESNP